MKVLHICYSDNNGGAAIGAYRLHHAMRHRGVDSTMLVAHKGTNDSSIISLVDQYTKDEFQSFLSAAQDLRALYGNEELPIRSINLSGFDIADIINQHAAEIVQLHWIANNTVKLSELPKIQKPIVWKMPDMWAFCGGEHYIRHGDPERYKHGYDKIGPYNGEKIDVDRLIWEAKKTYYQNLPLTITSPSLFLARAAHESVLLGEYDAHTIPNPLPWQFLSGDAPSELERLELRKNFDLPTDKLIIMFSAFNAKEQRKGFHHIEDMVINHLPNIAPPSKAAFMICGASDTQTDHIAGYDVYKFEATKDLDKYKKYLRTADIMLFPSEMDSTAMVIQEALSQGLPSVVFDVGGLPEMVSHKENGYLASPYNSKELADGIAWWIDCKNRDSIRKNAIDRARAMHNPVNTVERYLNLYQHILTKYRAKESFKTGTLHESVPLSSVADDKHRAFIIDPSAVGESDSSHHAEHVLAFSALFNASNIKPFLIINKDATLENPFGDTKKSLSWTIYDKIRVERDIRNGPAINAANIAELDRSSEKSLEVYKTLKQLHSEYSFARKDAIIFPTTDRFCLEGALLFLYSLEEHLSPSIHMNIMFEKAEFLLGRYPLEELMRAARKSGYLQKKLFLYAETKQMASDLSAAFQVHVKYLAPPHLFQKNQLDSISKTSVAKGMVTRQTRRTYETAEKKFYKTQRNPSITIPTGKHVIVSLGRGRRDKGWNLLPQIVEAFNTTPAGHNAVFVFQRPRKMDGLEAEEARVEKIPNVILLDEIISTEMLNDICTKADVFLLPYDPGVYRNRGSAFGWRAVLQGKPLVVMDNTALTEALLPMCDFPDAPVRETSRFNIFARNKKVPDDEAYCNGKTAKTTGEFASALADILKDADKYKTGAEVKMAEYFQSSVFDNPIRTSIFKDNFSAQRHTLIIQPKDCTTKPPQKAYDGYAISLAYSDLPSTEIDQLPLVGAGADTPIMPHTKLKDGAIDPASLPEFLVDALNNNRIDTVYVPYDLAINNGGLRNLPKEWRYSVVLY